MARMGDFLNITRPIPQGITNPRRSSSTSVRIPRTAITDENQGLLFGHINSFIQPIFIDRQYDRVITCHPYRHPIILFLAFIKSYATTGFK